MSENLKVFNYNGNNVRTVDLNGELWFVLKDVCQILGIADHKVTARRLETDEVCLTPLIDSIGRKQETTVINESGLYSVILRSDKEEAKPFRKWVTSEVLPSIRKHGAYITPAKLNELLRQPESVIKMLAALADEQKKNAELIAENKELTKKNEYMAPRADYCDNVLRSTSVTYLPTAIAKEYGWSAKKLNKILNELKIIYKVDDCWHLYSCCDGDGLVEYTERPYYDYLHGKMDKRSQIRWTERGKACIYDRLKKIGYLPREEAARKVRSH